MQEGRISKFVRQAVTSAVAIKEMHTANFLMQMDFIHRTLGYLISFKILLMLRFPYCSDLTGPSRGLFSNGMAETASSAFSTPFDWPTFAESKLPQPSDCGDSAR